MGTTASAATRQVHAVCSHDCPDTCGVLVTVNTLTGKAIKLQGDPAHPVTRGFLCGKVAKYLDRVYSPDRLLYPMRRIAPKGPLPAGKEAAAFERISWDQALETIAAKFESISQEFGPEAILPYSYAGTIGVLGYGSMDRRFFSRLGGCELDRTICSEAGGQAFITVYGRKLGTDTEDFPKAKLIIAWGANVHGNNIHLWPFVEEARRNGANLIVIDPYQTRTAKLADWHIAIRPGTDGALALGMMNVIFERGLTDEAYLAEFTHGAEALRERAKEYPPERVSQWTGIPAADIVKLAVQYATTTPAVIRMNYGIQRAENGGASIRAVAMLPCLTGAWKHAGGGAQLSTSGAFDWNFNKLRLPELAKLSPIGRAGRTINMSKLGEVLTEFGVGDNRETPVKALYVYNSNAAAVAPDQNKVLRGLSRPDLFTIVHEQFFTDTTDYADIVLPATTFFEHTDFQGAYGHYYAQLSQQAIAPLGESRPNTWVFRELARVMGFSEPCFAQTDEELIDEALASSDAWVAGISRDQLASEGQVRLKFEKNGEKFLPFAKGGFRTPSGKAELYSDSLAAAGLDPLPGFIPPTESRHSPLAQRYPLELLPRKADNYMNSTFANLAGHRKMEARLAGVLEIHPQDAETRGIVDGDTVAAHNDRGRVELIARVSRVAPPGVVVSQLDWAKLSKGGRNSNALTSEILTDIGGGATFYSTLVEVSKVGVSKVGVSKVELTPVEPDIVADTRPEAPAHAAQAPNHAL